MEPDEMMAREIMKNGARDYGFTPEGHRDERVADWRRLARGRTKDAFERLHAIMRRRDKNFILDQMLQSGLFVFWNTHKALEKPCDTFVGSGHAIILFDEHVFPIHEDAAIGRGCYTPQFLDLLRKKGKLDHGEVKTPLQNRKTNAGSANAPRYSENGPPDDGVGPDVGPLARWDDPE